MAGSAAGRADHSWPPPLPSCASIEDRVPLITIDIGANDPEDCGSWASLSKIASCFATGVPRAATNLATIMTRLRAAGRPERAASSG